MRFQNEDSPLTAEIIYEIFPEFDMIGRSMRLKNNGEEVVVTKFMVNLDYLFRSSYMSV